MRNEKGISLMNICIIVAIIFIIATICAFIFKESKEKNELNKFITQMELIQEKVNWVRSEYKIWEDYNPNETGNFYSYLQMLGFTNANDITNSYIDEFNLIIQEIDTDERDNWNANIDTILANYCYFSPEDLEEDFGLENIKFHIIVNFYTGNVISKTGVKEDDKIVYRQYDCKMGNNLVVPEIYNNEFVPKLEIIENYGLSQKIKISLDKKTNASIMEVYYYSDITDEDKKICSKLKGYSYNKEENAVYFNIDISGDYTFIVEDTNFVQYPKIELQINLCNPPQLIDGMMGIYWGENGNENRIVSEHDSNWYNYSKNELRFANAKTEDGNYWVWIPRYIYNQTTDGTDVEFVKAKTNIATNNKSMSGYKLKKAFSEKGEIEGFWINKFQGNIEEGKIYFKPGQTLSFLNFKTIRNKYKNMMDNSVSKYLDIMSEENKEAVLIISEAAEIEISNNLVHYAGGSPNEVEFKNLVKYSSTNNVYGVYDLITSENEITKETFNVANGRFRLTLIK